MTTDAQRRNLSARIRAALLLSLLAGGCGDQRTTNVGTARRGLDDRTVAIYQTTEWIIANPSFGSNPFDLEATATFVHTPSQDTVVTRLFFDGDQSWVLRFTPTRTGTWTLSTASADPELDGHTGTVTVNPDTAAPGFVTNFGNQWGRTGTGEAFVPNFVMWYGPGGFYSQPQMVDDAVALFFDGHGFNGLHIPVFNEWYQLGAVGPDDHSSPDPDPRTFEALEMAIGRIYQAGGVVHMWFTGDCANGCCSRWGPGSPEEARVIRYIGARLGPLPGWSMGYGFDISEDHTAAEVEAWHADMHAALGWFHFLGVRTEMDFLDNGLQRTNGTPFCATCDYESWVDHKPPYDLYATIMDRNLNKPCFLEDRFRIRDEGRLKDYSEEETRRGLWHATLAGGAAGIWGNLLNSPAPGVSGPYPNAEHLRTYGRFWRDRFLRAMVRCPSLTDGICLRAPGEDRFVFYAESVDRIQMDLSGMTAPAAAVAVDTVAPYAELDLGTLDPSAQTFNATYVSDWAVAVGDFEPPAVEPDGGVPTGDGGGPGTDAGDGDGGPLADAGPDGGGSARGGCGCRTAAPRHSGPLPWVLFLLVATTVATAATARRRNPRRRRTAHRRPRRRWAARPCAPRP